MSDPANTFVHVHCVRCFPNLQPGDTYIALCGTVRTRSGSALVADPPEDKLACIVCLDESLMAAHVEQRHGASQT